MKKTILVVLMLLVGTLGGVFVGRISHYILPHESITLLSLSPNDQWRVRIVEFFPRFIDRNIEVRLERINDGSTVTLFRSPDEGLPEGSERVVWSPDSKQFVLLGRHFHARDEAKMPNGESSYLFYDLGSGNLKSNATQQATYPGFGLSEVPWLLPLK